ncbi:MAG: sel1 repeat family protein, partial [Candidatus Methanomethylophilaceae archaeon]|nr:sel1 repeat family protein [Candidatus Methanomethylophilaceae archaeon]
EWFTRSADAGNPMAKVLIDVSDVDSIPENQRLRRLLLHSEEGDKDILLDIARCYEFGIGTKKDLQKSKEYREMLAADNDPDSQYWIASYLENRARTKADFDDAHAWYVKALDNGSEKARNRLDISDIKEVPENKLFAKCRLFMHSADPDIQYALGRCYELGLGVSVSYSLARSHYQRASDLGSKDAEEKLDRSRIKACTGYERYRRLMMFSDDRDPHIHHEIGSLYLEGKVVERSPSLAFGWFESAAGLGHAESALMCADMMYSDQVKQDKERMLAYYRVSADKGDIRSNRIIGKVLTEPGSKEKGHPEAVRRLRLAAHRNDPESQYLLGRMFEKGLGMPQFYAEAFRWYSLAADQGHFESRYRVMLFLFAGRGTKRNESKANIILDELRTKESNRLLRFVDSCIRGKDPLSIEFKAKHLS